MVDALPGFIIGLINNKGGTAKSTTTIHLAYGLALLGHKVLVVDNDPQSNTTKRLLGIGTRDRSLYAILSPDNFEGSPHRCIFPTPHDVNVDILPNVRTTSQLELRLAVPGEQGRDRLRDRLREYVTKNYDFTLIDCPPNLGSFVASALIASDFVIVPHEGESQDSLDGVETAVQFIEALSKTSSKDLKLLKILVTQVDMRTRACRVLVNRLVHLFTQEKIFETIIPRSQHFRNAELHGVPVFREANRSTGAKAYRELAVEVLQLLNLPAKTENGEEPKSEGV